MRTPLLIALALALAGSAAAARQQPAAPTNCDPSGPIRFVCGQAGPEDLVTVPGTAWLVASAYAGDGGLHLIDTKAGTSTRLFPTPAVTERLDRKTYDSCPGPLDAAAKAKYQTHGLFLKPGGNGPHTLYVVYHGVRESVEVFELETRKNTPVLTWIGCAVAPDTVGLNAVVALPDGGFAATNFDPRVPGGKGGFSPALIAGENNGEVWEWHTGTGWKKVPGSEAAGANGIEISPDGQWYYVAQWGNRSFMRISRGQTPVRRDQIPLGFRVDNVRWAPDGTLLVAGQGGDDNAVFGRRGAANAPPSVATSTIGKIDPKTMTYRQIINYPTSPAVSAATVAVEVGNEFWTGTFRGDRVARYPVKGLPSK
jgi:hypothetical protein